MDACMQSDNVSLALQHRTVILIGCIDLGVYIVFVSISPFNIGYLPVLVASTANYLHVILHIEITAVALHLWIFFFIFFEQLQPLY